MNFAGIQSFLAGQIAADAQLGALGTPIQVDPFQDPEAGKSAIASALRAVGVCIEVDFPWISAPETDLGGTTHIEAMCDVLVAEHPLVSHSPSKIALILRVVAACTKRPSGPQKPARLHSCESVKTESGYILHKITLSLPTNLTQP